jgi:hypothetical protein
MTAEEKQVLEMLAEADGDRVWYNEIQATPGSSKL